MWNEKKKKDIILFLQIKSIVSHWTGDQAPGPTKAPWRRLLRSLLLQKRNRKKEKLLRTQFEVGHFFIRSIWPKALCIVPIFHVSRRLTKHAATQPHEIIGFRVAAELSVFGSFGNLFFKKVVRYSASLCRSMFSPFYRLYLLVPISSCAPVFASDVFSPAAVN